MLYAKIIHAAQILEVLAKDAAVRSPSNGADDDNLRQVARVIQQLTCRQAPAAPADALAVEQQTGPTRTTLTSLPLELVVLVLNNLAQRDVHALALTCRYLSRPAVQRLHEHPTLGDVIKGDSFRSGFREDLFNRLLAVKSLTCTQWSGWSVWVVRLGILPNIETVCLSNGRNGIGLHSVLGTIEAWPRVHSLDIDCLDVFDARRAALHKPNLQIVDLRLTGHISSLDEPDSLEGLPIVLPNLRRLIIDVRRARFEVDTLSPLDGFPRLESVTLLASSVAGYCSWARPDPLRVVSKARQATLIGFDLATYVLSPGGALSGPSTSLETLVIFNVRTWDQIRVFMDRLASGGFPSLRRLLLVRSRVDASRGMTRGAPTDHLSLLRVEGFGGHLCSRVIHVERPPPERSVVTVLISAYGPSHTSLGSWWLGSAASRRAQQARAFCTCSPLDMDIEGVKVDIDGAWISCATRSAMGRDATNF